MAIIISSATPRGSNSSAAPANNGTRLAGINFPGHFSAFPEIYYPNDMGQKSDAVFAGATSTDFATDLGLT